MKEAKRTKDKVNEIGVDIMKIITTRLFDCRIYTRFLYLGICMLIGLTACTGMSSNFDCNVSSGGKCLPIDDINEMADRGFFDTANVAPTVSGDFVNNKTPNVTFTGWTKEQDSSRFTNKSNKNTPIRYGETVQQIWIAPFVDTDGNYHEPSYIYTVIKKGHWLGKPLAEIRS